MFQGGRGEIVQNKRMEMLEVSLRIFISLRMVRIKLHYHLTVDVSFRTAREEIRKAIAYCLGDLSGINTSYATLSSDILSNIFGVHTSV